MNFYTQDTWIGWIAIYLFFGGLRAATLSATFLSDLYLKPHKDLVLWGAWLGIIKGWSSPFPVVTSAALFAA